MKNCENCKYWQKFSETEYYEERIGLGECVKPKAFWQCTEWDEEKDYCRKLKEENKKDLMFVQDGSDYSAHLWTAPHFGCVCFEAL